MIRTSHKIAAILFLTAGSAALAGAQGPRDIAPECGAVFGGQICVGGTAVGSNIQSVTATVPLSVIQAAPPSDPKAAMKWPPEADLVISVPSEIRAGTGVDHFTFYWEAMGHPPTPFMTPHFDFHFYVVNNAARLAMDCKNEKKPATLPAGYALPDEEVPGLGVLKGVCVPLMGMHSMRASDAAGETPFSSTMVMGYYDQKPIFFEPMIAQAALLKKKTFSLPVPTPDGLPSNVHYPRHFTARWVDASQGYTFEFTDFK